MQCRKIFLISIGLGASDQPATANLKTRHRNKTRA